MCVFGWVPGQQGGGGGRADWGTQYHNIELVLDNVDSLSPLTWGPQHRVLRQLAHKLCWMGAVVELSYVHRLGEVLPPS